MKRGLDWYKREQRSILDAIRAAKMTDRQAAIYNIVIDLIYEGAGETPDDPKHIASYLSNVGQAAARTTIQQLIDMGKIFRVGEMLHQERAETEAQTRENLSEIRAKTGRLGGISSGKSRRARSNNNGLAEANASSKTEAEKIREEGVKEKGAGARDSGSDDLETAFDLITQICNEIGIDPDDAGYWADAASGISVSRWINDLGLTNEEILLVARKNAHKHSEPARGPMTLDRHMERFAAEKSAPALRNAPKAGQGRTAILSPEETETRRLIGLKTYADWVRKGTCPQSAISTVTAAEMVHRGLITADELKKHGFAV